MSTNLIFAYGSNMDERQMRARCPGARLRGPATLRGWTIAFAGFSAGWSGAVATLRRDRSSEVNGLVWAVGRCDLGRLDVFEGVPSVYRRRTFYVLPWGEATERLRVQAYLQPARAEGLPGDAYLRRIGHCYSALGFDPGPLFEALRRGGHELDKQRALAAQEESEP